MSPSLYLYSEGQKFYSPSGLQASTQKRKILDDPNEDSPGHSPGQLPYITMSIAQND